MGARHGRTIMMLVLGWLLVLGPTAAAWSAAGTGAGDSGAAAAATGPALDGAELGNDLQAASAGAGYWMVGAGGAVYPFGDAADFGSVTAGTWVTDLEPTPSGQGYWILEADGTVHTRGDATWFGGPLLVTGELSTGLSSTPNGDGYWVFTTLGRALAFGTATFFGDMSGIPLNGPVIDAIATPSGRGYYMVATDGGIFAFGDAEFHGSMGGKPLNEPVVGLSPTPSGNGYWLVATDGGIFAFGDAPFRGSVPGVLAQGVRLNRPVNGMVPYGNGYLMVASDGGIFSFSDLPFLGSLGANPPAVPVVGVAPFPPQPPGVASFVHGRVDDEPFLGTAVFEANPEGLVTASWFGVRNGPGLDDLEPELVVLSYDDGDTISIGLQHEQPVWVEGSDGRIVHVLFDDGTTLETEQLIAPTSLGAAAPPLRGAAPPNPLLQLPTRTVEVPVQIEWADGPRPLPDPHVRCWSTATRRHTFARSVESWGCDADWLDDSTLLVRPTLSGVDLSETAVASAQRCISRSRHNLIRSFIEVARDLSPQDQGRLEALQERFLVDYLAVVDGCLEVGPDAALDGYPAVLRQEWNLSSNEYTFENLWMTVTLYGGDFEPPRTGTGATLNDQLLGEPATADSISFTEVQRCQTAGGSLTAAGCPTTPVPPECANSATGPYCVSETQPTFAPGTGDWGIYRVRIRSRTALPGVGMCGSVPDDRQIPYETTAYETWYVGTDGWLQGALDAAARVDEGTWGLFVCQPGVVDVHEVEVLARNVSEAWAKQRFEQLGERLETRGYTQQYNRFFPGHWSIQLPGHGEQGTLTAGEIRATFG